MPTVDLTEYEVRHDLLPAVCARCGKPASDRVPHTTHVAEGRWAPVQVLGLLGGLFIFPPLAVLALRSARAYSVGVPLCAAHREDFRRRERIDNTYVLWAWAAAAVVVEAVVLIVLLSGGPGVVCYAPFGVLAAGVVASALVGGRSIFLTRPVKEGIRLARVHPAFVAALQADRARDRISNPDRRGGHGDMRDDYDDEPV